MADIAATLQRYGDLWALDRARFVAECYHVDAQTEFPGMGSYQGHGELLEREQLRYRLAPDQVLVPIRWLSAGLAAVVECRVTGRSAVDVTRMSVPSLLWWELDSAGLIRREVLQSVWPARKIDDGRRDGPLGATDGETLSQSGYRSLAERLSETWVWEPELARTTLYADDAEVVHLEEPDEADQNPRAWRPLAEPRRMTIIDTLGDRRTLAVRYLLDAPKNAQLEPARVLCASVFVLDVSDRIVLERRYPDLAL